MLASGQTLGSSISLDSDQRRSKHCETATPARSVYRSDTPGDNVLATVQALPALAGKPFRSGPSTRQDERSTRLKPTLSQAIVQRCVYFEQTSHNACQGFLAYWQPLRRSRCLRLSADGGIHLCRSSQRPADDDAVFRARPLRMAPGFSAGHASTCSLGDSEVGELSTP